MDKFDFEGMRKHVLMPCWPHLPFIQGFWSNDIWSNDIWSNDIWSNDIWSTDIWSNDTP
jgi:hypothetical protein